MNKKILSHCFMATLVTAGISSALATASTPNKKWGFDPTPPKYSEPYKNEQSENGSWLIVTKAPSIADKVLESNRSQNADNLKYTLSQEGLNTTYAQISSSILSVEKTIEADELKLTTVLTTSKLISGLVVKGSGEEIAKLRSHPSVEAIHYLPKMKLLADESANYIKATGLNIDNKLLDGEGITVSVIDTGVDYTHKDLGGLGTVAAYEEAEADLADVPAWPIGKVLGGFDFASGDPDPLDSEVGHGTHVAGDMLAVAPKAKIYAYRVCGAFSCDPGAILAAFERSMDPNNDGDISDRVDIITMSIGSDSGPSSSWFRETQLQDKIVELGTMITVAAGNSGANNPFIVSSPASLDNVLAVGAMSHPVTKRAILDATFDNEEIQAISAAFNPVKEFTFDSTTNPLVVPLNNIEACDAFATTDDFSQKTVIVKRGNCNFTTKILNAQSKGAAFFILVNNDDSAIVAMRGDPAIVDQINIPSVMISKEDGESIISNLVSGDVEYKLVSVLKGQSGAIATFTSRGPTLDNASLKPEITAPGSEIMAAAHKTGSKRVAQSGTSMSTPIVAGAIAIIREAHPERTALEIKALAMNTANLDITVDPRETHPDSPVAPISVIGSGLIDVEKAINSPVAAWDSSSNQAALSYGFVNAATPQEITKNIKVKNYSNENKTYHLSMQHRYDDDMNTGAIEFTHPETISIPAGQTMEFSVTLAISPSKLREWSMGLNEVYFGLNTPNPPLDPLSTFEYDGALVFSEDGENEDLHLAYHMLPRATAELSISSELSKDGVKYIVTNNGASSATPQIVPVDSFFDRNLDISKFQDFAAVGVKVIEEHPKCESKPGIESTIVNHASNITLITSADRFLISYITGEGDNDLYRSFPLDGRFFDTGSTAPQLCTKLASANPPLGGGDAEFFKDFCGPTEIELTSGNHFFTTLTCADRLDVVTGANLKVSYQLSEKDQKDFELTVKETEEVATLEDSDGNMINTLGAGNSAILNIKNSAQSFMLISKEQSTPVIYDADATNHSAPMITAGQMFDVDENSETGTVIGKITATDSDTFSPVREIYVNSQSSTAIKVKFDGTILVNDKALLDYEAGMTEIKLTATAIDTKGNTSEPADITIKVNNLVDTDAEKPKPEEKPTSTNKSGGSLGWLCLSLLFSMGIRRQTRKPLP